MAKKPQPQSKPEVDAPVVPVVLEEQLELFPEVIPELPEGIVQVHDHGGGIISYDR